MNNEIKLKTNLLFS